MERPDEVWLVKLGGSLLTDKREDSRLHADVLARVAREIVAATRPRVGFLVGHGGGSFGHATAARHGLNRGPLEPAGLAGVGETQERVRTLHVEVLRALLAAGGRPFSLSPSSFLKARGGRVEPAGVPPLATLWRSGLLPVVFGDVVADSSWGAAIASTETVFREIVASAPRLGVRFARAYWFGRTAGVLDGQGALLERLDADGAEALFGRDGGAADGSDVTGGMRHRVIEALSLAERGVDSWIADGSIPGRIQAALSGEDVPATHIPAAARPGS